MPRESAESVAMRPFRVDGKPDRLECRPDAPVGVQEAFRRIVNSVDPTHFAPADAPLVQRYAECIVQAERAAEELAANGSILDGKVSPWVLIQEKAGRAAVALSQRLRLCPQSRISQDKAETTARGSQPDKSDALRRTVERINRGEL